MATSNRSPTRAVSTRPTWRCARHRDSRARTSSPEHGHLTHFLFTFAVEASDVDARSAELWGFGAVGVEELTGALRAAFGERRSAEQARTALAPSAEIEELSDTHGLDGSRDLLGVEIAGGFAIHPPWLDPPPGRRPIEIDPGHAFGSGSHITTRLALELLENEAEPGFRIFDVGCGTGVLAIGAALLGARVVAVDIDPVAVAVTRGNAARNAVDSLVDVAEGSGDRLTDPVDLAILNVTIDIHEDIATLLPRTHPRLLVSGLLGEDHLRRCATAYDATIDRSLERDGWMAAVLTRS